MNVDRALVHRRYVRYREVPDSIILMPLGKERDDAHAKWTYEGNKMMEVGEEKVLYKRVHGIPKRVLLAKDAHWAFFVLHVNKDTGWHTGFDELYDKVKQRLFVEDLYSVLMKWYLNCDICNKRHFTKLARRLADACEMDILLMKDMDTARRIHETAQQLATMHPVQKALAVERIAEGKENERVAIGIIMTPTDVLTEALQQKKTSTQRLQDSQPLQEAQRNVSSAAVVSDASKGLPQDQGALERAVTPVADVPDDTFKDRIAHWAVTTHVLLKGAPPDNEEQDGSVQRIPSVQRDYFVGDLEPPAGNFTRFYLGYIGDGLYPLPEAHSGEAFAIFALCEKTKVVMPTAVHNLRGAAWATCIVSHIVCFADKELEIFLPYSVSQDDLLVCRNIVKAYLLSKPGKYIPLIRIVRPGDIGVGYINCLQVALHASLIANTPGHAAGVTVFWPEIISPLADRMLLNPKSRMGTKPFDTIYVLTPADAIHLAELEYVEKVETREYSEADPVEWQNSLTNAIPIGDSVQFEMDE